MNCAVGLGELGVHTLRTLLVGLHDENLQVRRTVARVITTKFNIDDILNYYCDSRRESQRMSLKIALKDTVEKDLHLKGDHHYKNFFKDLLTELEKEMK